MSKYAVLVPVQVRTRDRRTICWLECELHDGAQVSRDPLRPFFTLAAARAWATARGYEVQE